MLTDVGSCRTVRESVNLLLTALDSPDTNNINISAVIKDISNSDLISVIREVWLQLSTDSSRLCFCGQLIGNSKTSIILCEYILLPWVSSVIVQNMSRTYIEQWIHKLV